MKILLALLLFTTPVFAEPAEPEAYEEICEVTKELRKGIKIYQIRLKT